MRIKLIFKWTLIFIVIFVDFFIISCVGKQKEYYQCITVPERGGIVKNYVVKIDNIEKNKNLGLIILVKELEIKDEAYVDVNGNRYEIPAVEGGLLGKIVIPLSNEHLNNGLNRIAYFENSNSNGYQVLDSRIESVSEKSASVVGQTYRIVSRGTNPTISDFDFVINYRSEYKRKESEIPEWARRGRVRYYRAGIDFDHLDRMFEMFREAHINLVMLQVSTPSDKESQEYKRYKDFIDRCHENGIRVTFDGGAGGQPVRLNSISLESVILNPEMKNWISRDEYGHLLWRSRGSSYWPDLKNKDYRNEVLKTAKIAIEAGVDELYYDWAIGGTGDIIRFFNDVRELAKKIGKNPTIYGNCKGSILADEVCDIGKSEGTEEAGVWDGRWVHNVAQARFYYAAGDRWKSYRSKYEGANPGEPNPGAHTIIDEMKCGWKRPIAEAVAFQSDFVIAEAGRKLRNGWVLKNNETAMKTWKDICQYNGFLSENEDIYTDVETISRIGLLAPPLIPSFEVSLERDPIYKALVEMNIMYDVLLLPRITSNILAKYEAIIIPDIPWIDKNQLNIVKDYKNIGGKIYTIGSTEELRKLASVYSPSSTIKEIEKKEIREEFMYNLRNLSDKSMIVIENAEYVIANVVKKKDKDRIIIHFINYSEHLNDIKVKVNLEGYVNNINKESIRLYSPDNVLKRINDISVDGKKIEFTIPRLEIYDVVMIN